MVCSIDSKVTGEFLYRPEAEDATQIYYEINRSYGNVARGAGKRYAFACGRITMEGSFTGGYYPDLTVYKDKEPSRSDYVADKNADFYAIAFDRHGRLGWKSGKIDDYDPGYDKAHIIEVLTEETADEYLSYLKDVGVSYIFAGKVDTDMDLALEKLKGLFGIELILLEGGSIINGAFAHDGLIDEISSVVAPTVSGVDGAPLFADATVCDFELHSVKQYENGVLHTVYKRRKK